MPLTTAVGGAGGYGLGSGAGGAGSAAIRLDRHRRGQRHSVRRRGTGGIGNIHDSGRQAGSAGGDANATAAGSASGAMPYLFPPALLAETAERTAVLGAARAALRRRAPSAVRAVGLFQVSAGVTGRPAGALDPTLEFNAFIDGARGTAGAGASLTNAVSGSTTGSLTFIQSATGGAGGEGSLFVGLRRGERGGKCLVHADR